MAHLCLPLCALQQQPDKHDFMVCEGRRRSSHAFVQRVAALSRALKANLAVQTGGIVMIASLNTDYMLEALLAACDAGCIATPVNYRWSSAELAAAMRLTEPVCVLSDTYSSQLVLSAVSTLPEPGRPLLMLLGAAMIIFTSGTTGQSKGVVLSHAAIYTQSMSKLAVVGYSAYDRYMHTAPLFHIGGISSAHACLMAGASHVVLPRFTAADAADCIAQWQVTTFISVPIMMQDLTQHILSTTQQAALASQTHRSVRCVLLGAGATSPALKAAVCRAFPNARVLSAYGMTEAASSITFLTLIDPELQHGMDPATSVRPHPMWPGQGVRTGGAPDLWSGAACAGWPAPGVGVCVVPLPASDSPSTLAPGAPGCSAPLTVGEVWTRGPHTFLGYWKSEEETARVYQAGGWMRTGDMGFLGADGALWLRGRAKDMIKTGGENVYATEVEAALCSHPAVGAAAVVGVPHPRWGEAVGAVVVLRPGWAWSEGLVLDSARWTSDQNSVAANTGALPVAAPGPSQETVTAAELQQHCRGTAQLSPYKVPRVLAAVHSGGAGRAVLPVNASGKVVKATVRQALVEISGHVIHRDPPVSKL